MAYLYLEDGSVFEGKLLGNKAEVVGKVVFNTSMCGYEDILTDPSNAENIVVMTYPLQGNYGINNNDLESLENCKAVIVREMCKIPSNFKVEETFEDFLMERGLSGLKGMDTRMLTRHLRDKGEMQGLISGRVLTIEEVKKIIASNKPKNTFRPKTIVGNGKKIAVINLGIKKTSLANLVSASFEVTLFPEDFKAEDINGRFDMIIISDGHSYNEENVKIEIQKLKGKILAIGEGHLLLSKSFGLEISNLKTSHRGGQPIKDLKTGNIYTVGENMGRGVTGSKQFEVAFKNANDGEIEGVRFGENILSIAFMPDSINSKFKTGYILKDFIDLEVK